MLRILPIKTTLVIFLYLSLCLLSNSTFSQNSVETVHSVDKFLKQKDERALNDDKNKDGLKYDNIAGSPFYNNNYQAAHLYKNKERIGTAPVKLNFLTNEIYFLQGEKELVIEDGKIDSLVFFNTPDSATFISCVENLLLENKK